MQKLWRRFVPLVLLVPLASTFIFMLIYISVTSLYDGTFKIDADFFKVLFLATGIGSLFNYSIMVLAGVPAVVLMEKFRINGILSYGLCAAFVGLLASFPIIALLLSVDEVFKNNYWHVCAIAGFVSGLMSYFIMHYDDGKIYWLRCP